jgi:hypothetical protein
MKSLSIQGHIYLIPRKSPSAIVIGSIWITIPAGQIVLLLSCGRAFKCDNIILFNFIGPFAAGKVVNIRILVGYQERIGT